MPDLTKTLDEHVTDLETIYTDLPEIMNLRFERFNAQASEINSRLGLMDKQFAALTRDVRDLRSGMTAQLRLLIEAQRSQGEELRKQGEELRKQGEELRKQGEKLDRQEAMLAEILTIVKK